MATKASQAMSLRAERMSRRTSSSRRPVRIPGATRFGPYVTAGLGVIRAMFDSANDQFDTAQNNFGFNAGGGVMYALTDRVGVRVDLRYFRAFVDDRTNEGGFFKDYGFLRATFGVTVGFPR